MGKKFKRIFRRENADGTHNAITVEWDSERPTQTFSLESEGYKGTGCLSELRNIEELIGVSSIEEKPEIHDDDGTQDVFIVGFGGNGC